MDDEKLENASLMLEKNLTDRKKWLTFWLQEQLFGISITNVEQIVSMQTITEVPEYPVYAKGIINLRGVIIPVIDLRVRLGKTEKQYTDHTCIIINSVGDEHIGFIVDEVESVIDIPAETISTPPRMGEDGVNRYLTGIARVMNEDMKEDIVLCLDASRVLLEDEFKILDTEKIV